MTNVQAKVQGIPMIARKLVYAAALFFAVPAAAQVTGVVVDVPPGVESYETVRYDCVTTGSGDLGLMHFGKFQDKVYWYFYTKLVDEKGNYLGLIHPEGKPEFVQIRVRFTNGLKHVPIIDSKPIRKLHLSARYYDAEMKLLFQHSFYNATADKVNDHLVLERRSSEEWSQCKFIVLTPLMLLDGYSIDTSQSPHVGFEVGF